MSFTHQEYENPFWRRIWWRRIFKHYVESWWWKHRNNIIVIPHLLGTVVNYQAELIHRVFPGVHDVANVNIEWLCSRAIRTPTNEQAFEINRRVMSLFQSEEIVYRSVNTTLREDDAINYPAEFLDTVTSPAVCLLMSSPSRLRCVHRKMRIIWLPTWPYMKEKYFPYSTRFSGIFRAKTIRYHIRVQ